MAFPYRLLSLYPPFVGAGIRVHVDERDPYTMTSTLTLRWYNRNAWGTHFGGSLYAMTDAFFALILIKTLGPGYSVWDKSASVTFLRPGAGTVKAVFHIPKEEVEAIRARVDAGETLEPTYVVDVVNAEGKVVARVEKVLHVRCRAPRLTT
jgi:acyl-coenzyme A thioesterase PaaI-like protein